MGSKECSSKGGDHFEGGLLSFRFQPSSTNVFEPGETIVSNSLQMIDKKAITPVQKATPLGFYSRLFVVPKPGKKWRPVIDMSVVNEIYACTNFQNGICQKYSRFSSTRRVGYLTIPYRCLFSHTNTPTVSEISSLQCRLQILPVHCLTFPNRYGSTRVHHGCKRGATDGTCRRHQDSPVYRRLGDESKKHNSSVKRIPTG